MARTIVILQSNYIPWKGYFDLMNAADEFVLFDEVQFTRRDWRNRNKVIVGGAAKWLTIPVETKGRYDVRIDEVRISDAGWASKHFQTLRHAYGKAPYWRDYGPKLEALYTQAAGMDHLSTVNRLFLGVMAGWLGITTPLGESSDLARTTADPGARLIEICLARGASDYLSGPAARSYIDPDAFARAGLGLHYADYTGYPEYDQGGAEFTHGVSALDLLMRLGPVARDHLKSANGPIGLAERTS
ncbi:MAG: WbqC family protein [Pseudomonadota bacterium]